MDFKVAGTPGVRHRAAARHQARRHPVGRAGRRAAAGARGPADHPRRDAARRSTRRPRCREYAPRVTTVKIPVDKIGMVIGPKGQTINAIQDETGAEISIEDDGTIYVGATNGPSAQAAVERINAHRQPDPAEGGRPVPRHGGEDRRVRRVHLAAAGPRRPAAHLQGGRRQAGREGRGLPQRRRQGRGGDRGHRRPRQDLPGQGPPGGRRGAGRRRGRRRRPAGRPGPGRPGPARPRRPATVAATAAAVARAAASAAAAAAARVARAASVRVAGPGTADRVHRITHPSSIWSST